MKKSNKTKRRNNIRYKTRRRNKTLNKTRRKNRRRNNTRNRRIIKHDGGGSPRKWWFKRKAAEKVENVLDEILKNKDNPGVTPFGELSRPLGVQYEKYMENANEKCKSDKESARKTIKKKGKWSLRTNKNIIKRISNPQVKDYILKCCNSTTNEGEINTLIKSLEGLVNAYGGDTLDKSIPDFLKQLKDKQDYEKKLLEKSYKRTSI